MKREERKIYTTCITGMAVAVVAAVVLMTKPATAHIAKNAPYEDDNTVGEYFIEETAGSRGNALFDENSAMPCCDRESFEKWMETYEQETSKERPSEGTEVFQTAEAERVPTGETEEVQMETEIPPVETAISFYSVDGLTLNPELQRYLYSRLQEFGCEWFFRYSLCQLYQESRYDSNAVGKSGLDCGLCQFRYPYFPSVAEEAGLVEYDIFNPIDSIYVYTYLMCKYLNETGGDVAMSLSLYYSGYGGPYSSEYVKDVTQWFETMKEVK